MPEAARIVALRRMDDDFHSVKKDVEPGPGVILRPVQLSALSRIKAAGGGLLPIGVGHGKFLISVLAPTVLKSKRPVLLVPPALVEQTKSEIEIWRRRVKISPDLVVFSYGKISTVAGKNDLSKLNPDLIVADEAHYLRHRQSARTRRVIRFFLANEDCKFVALSGTLISRSLKDASHLSELALRDKSPIPRTFQALRSWSRVIDVRPDEPPTAADYRRVDPLKTWAKTDNAREAFFKRLESAPGVCLTSSSAFEGSLEIYEHTYELPEKIETLLKTLKTLWISPAGYELASPLDISRVGRQLISGYYTQWKWPGGRIDHDWLDARNDWSKACRAYIQRNRSNIDTPLEVINLIKSGGKAPIVVQAAWEAWEPFSKIPAPPVEAVWLSKEPTDFLRSLIDQPEVGLIWTESPFVLDSINAPRYGAGNDPPTDALKTIALSRRAHGTGKNLQAYSLNASIGLPPSGEAVEQLFGRTHRPGQQADKVEWRVAIPSRGFGRELCLKGLAQVRKDARFVQSLGQKTKALSANWVGFKHNTKKTVP